MAQTPTCLNRRNLAGAALLGFTAIAGGAAPPPSADAQLIAMGIEGRRASAQYSRLQDRWWALKVGDAELKSCAAEMDVPHNRLCDLAERARDMTATTPEGWQAKAVLLRHLMVIEHGSDGKMEFETFDQEMMWSLICDMTGGEA